MANRCLLAYNRLRGSRQGRPFWGNRKRWYLMKNASLWLWLTLIGTLFAPGCGGAKSRVVLYCAQDQEFADQVLGEFTQRTGLKVDPKFDTEADKSVSLYVELVNEKARPRCSICFTRDSKAGGKPGPSAS